MVLGGAVGVDVDGVVAVVGEVDGVVGGLGDDFDLGFGASTPHEECGSEDG